MCAEEAMCGIIDWFTWGPLAEVSGRELVAIAFAALAKTLQSRIPITQNDIMVPINYDVHSLYIK